MFFGFILIEINMEYQENLYCKGKDKKVPNLNHFALNTAMFSGVTHFAKKKNCMFYNGMHSTTGHCCLQ